MKYFEEVEAQVKDGRIGQQDLEKAVRDAITKAAANAMSGAASN